MSSNGDTASPPGLPLPSGVEPLRVSSKADIPIADRLSRYDRWILELLSEDGGFVTGHIARNVPMFGSNGHQQSGTVRSWLIDLKKRGLVRFLDDQKPVCWVRTAAGTAALFAQTIEARRGETAQQARCEARERGGEADAPEQSVEDS